ARREGSADGAVSADRRRDHPHRASSDGALTLQDCRMAGLQEVKAEGQKAEGQKAEGQKAEGQKAKGRRQKARATASDWFKRFIARKEAEALAARLEPWRTDVDRHGPDQLSLGNDWTRARFDGDFYVSPSATDLPSTSLVFVQSRDGNT